MNRPGAPAGPGRLTGWRRVAVPASLLLSFACNDGEELLTMAATTPTALARAPRWVRGRVRPPGQRHVTVAIGLMAVLVGAASVDGVRTAGRGRLYQDVQLVYGLHGLSHLGSSAVTRGYTTGVVTSPTVVLPQLWWARRSLHAARVPDAARLGRALALTLGWLAASHAIAAAATRA